MNVLTWHGAVVCADMPGRRLVQAPLWQANRPFPDFDFDANALYPRHALLGGFHVDPGPRRHTIHIRRGAVFLGADATGPDLLMEQETAGEGETFLLLEASDLADLRHVFERRWLLGANGRRVRKSSVIMRPGFHLDIGPASVDLTIGLPLTSPGRFRLAEGGGSPRLGYAPPDGLVLREAGGSGADVEFEAEPDSDTHEVALRPAAPTDQLRTVKTEDDFVTGRNCRVFVKSADPIFMMPPLMVQNSDKALFIERQWRGEVPRLGFVSDTWSIRRESQRYVALMRGAEGMIFSKDGETHAADPLGEVEILPRGFTRNARGVMADLDYLEEMPRLPGSYFIFYDNKLENWFHWLAGAMLALDMTAQILPPRTKLLLPPSLMQFDQSVPGNFDHFELMRLLGFDKLPAVEAVTDVVQVEEAIVLESAGPETLPAEYLRGFRNRLLDRTGTRPPRRRRLFVRRRHARALDEPEAVIAFLERKDFEVVDLDELPIDSRISMFQEAEIVVAAHGAELANLLFCQEGARVIELMPDMQCRPAFWSIANKLGLTYAMLGCSTHDMSFEGRLMVDVKRLAAIYRMVTSYR